jgi:hypothetical protein
MSILSFEGAHIIAFLIYISTFGTPPHTMVYASGASNRHKKSKLVPTYDEVAEYINTGLRQKVEY